MLGALTVIVLLFSMAGIYALMAFIVAQRWHEIGVRAALGAQPRRLLIGIFGRAAVPLLIGALAGCLLAIGVHSSLPIAEVGGRSIPGVVPVSASLMVVVGLLAVGIEDGRPSLRREPYELRGREKSLTYLDDGQQTAARLKVKTIVTACR